MRAFSVIAGLVAVALLAAWPVGAQQPGREGILESSYGVEVTIPTGALQEHFVPQSQEIPGTGMALPQQNCGQDHFTLNQSGNWFRFREEPTQNGCGEVRFSLDLPANTMTAVVHFKADRAIQQSSTIADLPKDMEQELRSYGPDGALAVSYPYFEPASGEHLVAEPFTYPLTLQEGQPNLTVAWMFWDRGAIIGGAFVNPVLGQGFSATVRDPQVDLEGIPLVPQEVLRERLGLQGGTVRYATTLVARVPDTLGVAGQISVHVRVADGLAFSHVLGPRGEPIAAALVESSENEGVRTIVLTGNATSAYGAGMYRLVFISATPISPSPLLYPFIATVMAVPAGAGLLALRSTRQFRQQATPEFAHTAANLDHVVLVMLGVYLLLPIGVLVSGRLPLLASWPLEGEAGLVYLLIGLAFVAFLAVGFVGRRHLSTLMLEEQAMKEGARRELERSNRELEEFAYVASHDLQEPLRTVASYTQLLQRRYKGRLDADADEFIDSAVQGAQRMQHLIQDLLTYSRVGSRPEAPAPVDLGVVMEGVRRGLAQAVAEAQAQVVTAKGLPTLVGNEMQFSQLLQNLVANAIKFRAPDRPCRVEVGSQPVAGGWRVTVKDNGIGIEERHFKRIFQIFQRLHGRDEYAGNGIGLAVCKRIVELAGGRIGVESVPGQGSTFWFTWPDRPPGAAGGSAAAGAAPA